LRAAIGELGGAWHESSALDNVWFLQTQLSPRSARSSLAKVLGRDDQCVIVDITDSERDGWMPKELWRWLRESSDNQPGWERPAP